MGKRFCSFRGHNDAKQGPVCWELGDLTCDKSVLRCHGGNVCIRGSVARPTLGFGCAVRIGIIASTIVGHAVLQAVSRRSPVFLLGCWRGCGTWSAGAFVAGAVATTTTLPAWRGGDMISRRHALWIVKNTQNACAVLVHGVYGSADLSRAHSSTTVPIFI